MKAYMWKGLTNGKLFYVWHFNEEINGEEHNLLK